MLMGHTIELKKVSKYYANENAVSMGFAKIDLTLDMGEFVAITGESGSGKSTLLNVLSGLDSYDEGEMFVCGEDTTAFSAEEYERYRKTYIGNIFQDFNLINSYTVYQNIELVMLMCGKKAAECKERINELISLVGLEKYAKTKASKLSGGQKQRVAIARALAKDAPIIVADEPTGNLDSESANLVMETLSRVSKEKLVIIVTHNYEQVEPYATRKLTMNDGRIIEDKQLRARTESAAASDKCSEDPEKNRRPAFDDMRKGSEIRLGLRNTFNLPSKFILLFIVYFFVCTAVLGQYASIKNNLNETENLGYNAYFNDARPERVIVTKSDRTVFGDEDVEKLSKLGNVESVVKNDIGMDQRMGLLCDDYILDVSVYPVSDIKESDLDYGKLPSSDNEMVLYTNQNAMDYSWIKDQGEQLIGKQCTVESGAAQDVDIFGGKLTIVGIVIEPFSGEVSVSGLSKMMLTENESAKIQQLQIANICETDVNYNGTRITYKGRHVLIPSSRVSQGKAYVTEDVAPYFNTVHVEGKNVSVSVKNSYYSDSVSLKIDKVVNKKNIEKNLGIAEKEYENYADFIFVSSADYARLFNKGNYQLSVFMNDETDSANTIEAIEGLGYKTFHVKESLTDVTGGFLFVIKLITFASLIIEFIVLFFIAYAVIRLIMKLRNSYYSTLRILGAGKKNTDNVLKLELLVMMLIAYCVDIAVFVLTKMDVIHFPALRSKLNFLSPLDCVALLVVMIVMSLLIARRYSRKIFSKSAMNAYREEV